MIKFRYVILLFALSNCSVFNDFKNVTEITRDAFTTKKFYYQELKEINYSPNNLIISLDDGDEFITYLEPEKLSWTTIDNRKFFFKHGKLIKTIGLQYDFEIINYQGFQNLKKSNAYLEFKDPNSSYLDISFTYSEVKEGELLLRSSNKKIPYRLIKEDFIVKRISWSGSNYYWVDSNNNVLMSKQIISPFNNKIRVLK